MTLLTRIAATYDRYRLLCDFVCVACVSAISIYLVEKYWSRDAFSDSLKGNRQAIYSAVISTAGSMLGFVLATVSIIVGYIQMPRFKLLRESRHHDTLYEVYFTAVYALALLTACGFVALFLDQDTAPRAPVTYAVFSLCLLCTVRVFRCIQVLKRVTKLSGKPTD